MQHETAWHTPQTVEARQPLDIPQQFIRSYDAPGAITILSDAQLLRRLPARPHLIPQNYILPRNLRQRDKTGIGSYLRGRLMLELSRPGHDLGADRLEGWG
ncbi:hypothetical protein [Acetobacter persici]|uniref:hypothetical protein n=1 Tax=Acetobacter persici TaxID=1076596 RepID=UPI001F39A1B0|nr:hypothetical protein [Acetobacter persici]MCG0998753.1 hypothetical protein [Acetobacter persici]